MEQFWFTVMCTVYVLLGGLIAQLLGTRGKFFTLDRLVQVVMIGILAGLAFAKPELGVQVALVLFAALLLGFVAVAFVHWFVDTDFWQNVLASYRVAKVEHQQVQDHEHDGERALDEVRRALDTPIGGITAHLPHYSGNPVTGQYDKYHQPHEKHH